MKISTIVIAAIAILSISALVAAQAFMPVEEVKAGMTGTVFTTLEGTNIEEFQAEVVGILPNVLGPKSDLILVKLLGEKMEFQGVASGMSGSPFYIDGKLVGALSYRIGSFPKEPLAGVTPISAIVNTQYGAQGAPQLAVDYHKIINDNPAAKQLLDKIGVANIRHFSSQNKSVKNIGDIRPITLTLSHSGIDQQTIAAFAPMLGSAGMELAPSATLTNANRPIAGYEAKPGAPFSVLLMTGDMNMGASGTITFIDGKKLYGFGHPLFQLGTVNFPIAEAQLVTVLKSLQGSSNLVSMGDSIGTLMQDRAAAVYGQLGEKPEMIDMNISINYDEKSVDTFTFQLVKHDIITPNLVAVAISNSMLVSQRQQGPLSATFEGEFRIEGYPSVKIKNFFSGDSIVTDVSYLAAAVHFFLVNNIFVKADITEIDIKLDLTEDLRSAALQRAWLTKTELKPNEQFELIMELKPHRGRSVYYREQYMIPPTLQSGTYKVVVGNGAAIGREEDQMVKGSIELKNFDHLIRLINSLRPNNRLYAMTFREEEGVYYEGDFFPSLPPSALSVIKSNKGDDNFVGLTGTVKDERRIETGYLVTGVKKLSFTVKR